MVSSPRNNQKQNSDCAKQLKVLSDQARMRVLELLFEGPQFVYQLNETLRMEQTLLSHHLKVLKKEGFVETKRSGRHILYSLTSSVRSNRKKRALNLGCCELQWD